MEIREFIKNDEDKARVCDFFSRLGYEGTGFFNRNNCNFNGAMNFFNGDDSNCVRFMAINEESGKMDGYVFLWKLNYRIPWLGIAVAEDAKGKGLGKKLIQHMIDYCKERDKGGIFLTTHAANFRAQALYEGYGFERIGMESGTEILYILNFKEN